LYEYECPKDGRFELIRQFSDPPLKKCPKCGRPVEKLASAPAIQFKGTGWYVTDYAKKSGGGKGGEESKGGGKTDSKGEAGKAESKGSESKSGENKSSDSSASKDAKESTPTTSTKDSSAPKGSSPT
jgi:putative FmdB family regulatory protein